MKKFLALVLLLATISAQAWEQTPPLPTERCQPHNPYGWAQTSKQVTAICRRAYFVVYDAAAKIPNYVTYTLTPPNALGCWPRTNAFVADKSVVNGATPNDYAGTGYDKGHAVPDGDLSWDEQVEYESFLMTNMYPQLGGFNRGIWKLLETSVRGWAVQTNQVYTIYVGAVYNTATDKKIGKGVVVPTGFYKIVINQSTGQAAGWYFNHEGGQGNDLTKARAAISAIQNKAGVKFAFPANIKELPIGGEWPVDYGALTNAKRAKCKGAAN
jgi:endonuclease G, mitochondrial